VDVGVLVGVAVGVSVLVAVAVWVAVGVAEGASVAVGKGVLVAVGIASIAMTPSVRRAAEPWQNTLMANTSGIKTVRYRWLPTNVLSLL
jgi:hypothetical protein